MEGVDRGVLVLQHPDKFFFDKDVEICGGSMDMIASAQADAVALPPKSAGAPGAKFLAWFGKMKGGSGKPPPAPPLLDVSPPVLSTSRPYVHAIAFSVQRCSSCHLYSYIAAMP